MDVMQVGLGGVLLCTAVLIVFGQSIAGSTPAVNVLAILAVCLTLCAAVIGAIRNSRSRPL